MQPDAPTPDPATLARWCALAAELDGWRWMVPPDDHRRYLVPPEYQAGLPVNWKQAAGEEEARVDAWPLPAYATDLNAVARLEALVRERGLARAYVQELAKICEATCLLTGNWPSTVTEFGYRFATATAAQRLEAVLRACGVIGEGE